MGAWAVDAFGNDDACDWALSLEKCIDLSLIEDALDKVLRVGPDYLEAPEACEALAAMEAIARLQGRWGERSAYSKRVDAWVEKTGLRPDPDLIDKARRASERILSEQSELAELWDDRGDSGDWRASVLELKARVLG